MCGEQTVVRGLFAVNGFHVVRCANCSLTYINELPSAADFQSIYSADFFRESAKFADVPNSASFLNANKRLEKILSLNAVGLDSWLDVGCATGEFVKAAQARVKYVCGVEFSPEASAQARQRGAREVMTGSFLEAPLGPGQFDVVTMWDFIEHVPDPMANLRKAAGLLKPGGRLFLSTGDVSALCARLTGRFWHLMIPPKHLYFFSQRTMQEMMAKAGFKDCKVSYPAKHVPLDFVIYKFVQRLRPGKAGAAQKTAARFNLQKVMLSLNLYDIMEISTRKPVS